eukprot:TRINITY_DN109892_c0_g1_i1.p1 TRINITY_DN109892_c0_g1~~TRINITY_DN109892_c0_g1_i1.p1  ORF type:complete len:344 (+),score=46.13 TRINITY_DN109892_c0_g1_i1:30-1061(+)
MDAGSKGILCSAALPFLGALVGAKQFSLGYTKAKEDCPDAKAQQIKYAFVTYAMIGVCVLYGCLAGFVMRSSLQKDPSVIRGNVCLSAGVLNGVTCFAVAIGLGMFGSAAVECGSRQPRLFVAFVLISIYIEAFALYALIITLTANGAAEYMHANLSEGLALPFASVDMLANLGGLLGTVFCGRAIMEVGVERSSIKPLVPVVFNGVTGIYGLISAILDITLPVQGDDSVAGLLYVLSSVCLTYYGCRGVRATASDDGAFVAMILRLIASQSVGLLGLILSLLTHSTKDLQTVTTPLALVSFSIYHGPVYTISAFLVSSLFVLALLLSFRMRPPGLEAPLLAA